MVGRGPASGAEDAPRDARRRATLPNFWRYFVLFGVVAVLLVAGGSACASGLVGEDLAIEDVNELGDALGRSVVAPAVTADVVAGDAAALAEFDRLIRSRLLAYSVVRVKLWDGAGRIVYSDEPRLIGLEVGLQPHEASALASGDVKARRSDHDEPSDLYEAGLGPLLEVYVPIQAANGELLLFEMYTPYEEVASHRATIWGRFLPVVLGLVLLVGVLLLTLARRVSRRVREDHEQKERLLRRAVDAADLEDRRLAGDLHDGVVQDLAGAAYSLAAARNLIEAGDDMGALRVLRESEASVGASVGALRSIVAELAPASLREEGLERAVGLLIEEMAAAGVATSFRARNTETASERSQALAYRVVRESLRNVSKHARAQRVSVSIEVADDVLTATVADDGCGFMPDAPRDRERQGLRLVSDLAVEIGGELSIESAPGLGCTVMLEVPA